MSRRSILIGLILGAVVILAGGTYGYYRWMNRPLSLDRPVRVRIREGMSARDIGRLLEKEGAVRSVEEFRWAVWFTRAERDLKKGAVQLEPPMNMRQLITTLQRKHPLLVEVQIREGWPSWRIFDRLSRKLDLSRKGFDRLFDDETFLRSLNIRSRSLEGYLFPDTYFFSSEHDHRGVLRQMIQQFRDVARRIELKKRAEKVGLSLDEAVRLASLIEREARIDAERRIISGVFHNRLSRGMALGADPSLLYEAGNFRKPITHRMLYRNTPYNTYRHAGLPPGPICSPGEASLEASVHPAEVPYLYFVSRGDGSHAFNRDLTEHRRAVRKYQR